MMHAKGLIARGAKRRASGDLKGAIKDYTRAIRVDPRSIKAYIGRSATYWYLAQRGTNARRYLRAAARDLKKVLKIAPPNWRYRRLTELTLKLMHV